MSEIHLNDIGTRILLQFTDSGTPFNFTALSSLSSLALCLKPPVAVTKTFALTFASTLPTLAGTTFAGDGSDGWTEFTVVNSDTWDAIGQWQLQGHVVGGVQEDFRSQVQTFEVFGNICL